MFTVALIGPDGAGKTTIARRLAHVLPLPVKYVYMGVNPDSSSHLLPTTRLIHRIKRARGAKPDTRGPRDPNEVKPRPRGIVKRFASGLRASLRLTNQIAEEWFHQAMVWYYQHRGYVVVFDRHYFSDYYAYDIAQDGRGRSLDRRIHGFLLQRVYPQPDLVLYLDAPAAVLFARKGEGTIELLEQRRREYLQMRNLVKHFVVVDAAQSEDKVVQAVSKLIYDFYKTTKVHYVSP